MIRVGPAGWDYPDWQGVVYPPRLQGTDRLSFLTQLFPTIEINVTFYRPISATLAQRWLAAVADRQDFRFTAKLFRGFTHERPPLPWPEEGAVKAGLEVLLAAGRLGALLAQFPYSFHNTAENRAYLSTVRQRFREYPLAVEVRHRSWQQLAVRQFLAEQQLAFCNIDQPQVSYALGETDWVSGPLAYLRLHGRNRRHWFAKSTDPGARYDYLYAPTELAQLAARARRLTAQAPETYLIFNNHPRGQGVA
ncbi:MAG: DUF72 domain-containing protein, partial [Desulfobacca sp.]|uniref:DUF72 domain-containing protein n=1 Tax=Desulfobacca sp. TaxID=2067990 RepID=UPI0040499FC9